MNRREEEFCSVDAFKLDEVMKDFRLKNDKLYSNRCNEIQLCKLISVLNKFYFQHMFYTLLHQVGSVVIHSFDKLTDRSMQQNSEFISTPRGS